VRYTEFCGVSCAAQLRYEADSRFCTGSFNNSPHTWFWEMQKTYILWSTKLCLATNFDHILFSNVSWHFMCWCAVKQSINQYSKHLRYAFPLQMLVMIVSVLLWPLYLNCFRSRLAFNNKFQQRNWILLYHLKACFYMNFIYFHS